MSLSIDSRALGLVLGAGAAVTTGSAATNWGLKGAFRGKGWLHARSHLVAVVGMGLFLIGWGLAMVSFGIDIPKANGDVTVQVVTLVMAGAIIVGTGLLLRQRMELQHDIGWFITGLILYIAGWFVEAAFLSMRTTEVTSFDGTKAAFAFPGAVIVLLSTLWLMPSQRKSQDVDGPSYSLYAFGWALVALGHAIKKP